MNRKHSKDAYPSILKPSTANGCRPAKNYSNNDSKSIEVTATFAKDTPSKTEAIESYRTDEMSTVNTMAARYDGYYECGKK